ncbi:MAG: NAD(+)/NADH kinase [Spirochaetes bacterium]|nr:NAD(+)/NADH kinase [Spirochaetota bacterium]
MKQIKQISLLVNLSKPEAKNILKVVLEEGAKYGIRFLLDKECATFLGKKDGVTEKDFLKGDLALALGGDGTFIRAAGLFFKKNIPLLGIHIGGLGFLTEFKQTEIGIMFKNIAQNHYKIEDRLVIEASVVRKERVIKVIPAFNEVVIHKGGFTRLIQLKSFINGQYIGTFEGDGMIVATPTGSTGYSLSASGPIVVPGMKTIIINTICPHTLGVRPIVVPSSSVIDIHIGTEYKDMVLSIDGSKGLHLKKEDKISIKESKYLMKLIKSPKRNFFDILREKFEWVK